MTNQAAGSPRKFWRVWILSVVVLPVLAYAGYMRWMAWYLAKSVQASGVLPKDPRSIPGWSTVEWIGTYGLIGFLLMVTAILIYAGRRYEAQRASRITVVMIWSVWMGLNFAA